MTKKMLFPTPKAVIEQIPISDDMEAVTTALQEWKGAGGVPLPVTYSSKLHRELQKCGWDIVDQKTIVKKPMLNLTVFTIIYISSCLIGMGLGIGLVLGNLSCGVFIAMCSFGALFLVIPIGDALERRFG